MKLQQDPFLNHQTNKTYLYLKYTSMKRLIIILLLSFTFFEVFAQDDIEFSFQNPQITNDGTNDFYEVDVYVASTSEFLLGIGQFYFTYNTAAFGDNPELDGRFTVELPAGAILDQGIDATPFAKFYSTVNTFQNTVGRISVNWQHVFAHSTKANPNVTNTPTLLCRLRIQYLDVSQSPEVCYSPEAIFQDQNAVACGPFVSANPFEAADCTNFPAVVVTDDSYDCSGATIGGGSSCVATTTWNGTSWDNGTPDSTTEAIINGDYNTATANIEACELIVNSGFTLSIGAGEFIAVQGNITVEGSLLIAHQGSVVQIDDSATVTNNGTINVDVTTPNLASRDFMVLGSPMTGETRGDVYATAFLVLDHTTGNFVPNPDVAAAFPMAENFADDNYDNWQPYNGAITPGEGFIVRPQAGFGQPGGIFNFTHDTGTLNNGELTFNVIFNTTKNDSPNVLSNPYPSAISADDFINANAMVDEVYFWEHLTPPSPSIPGAGAMNFSMEDISMYNLMGGIAATADPTGTVTQPNGVISTSQGFGIKANNAGTAIFNNAMRLTTGNNTLRQTLEKERLWLSIMATEYPLQNTTLIGFSSATTQGIDTGYDSRRLATVLSLFSHLEDGSEELGIQSRERFDAGIKIPLGFSTLVEEETTYEISINNIEGANLLTSEVFLYDTQTGIETNLTYGDSYSFRSNKASESNRFILYFTSETILSNNDLTTSTVSLYPNPADQKINIRATEEIQTLTLFDMQGRKVKDKNVFEIKEYSFDLFGIESGVYFMEIKTPGGRTLKKFIKK